MCIRDSRPGRISWRRARLLPAFRRLLSPSGAYPDHGDVSRRDRLRLSLIHISELNAEAEASSLVNVYRLAAGLSPQEGAKLRELARAYGDAVVFHEWREMDDNIQPTETREISSQMWSTLMAVKAATPNEITVEDHALYELSALAGYRRVRLVESASRLPGVLWFVLLAGAGVTVGSTWMFGASNGVLHGIQVSAFTLLISLALAAIADINRPYQGSVHVSDYAFRRAQMEMKEQ